MTHLIVPHPFKWEALHVAPFVTAVGDNKELHRITAHHYFGGKQVNWWFEGERDARRFWRAITSGEHISPDIWRLPIYPFEEPAHPWEECWYAYTFVNVLTAGAGTTQNFTLGSSFNRQNNIFQALGGGGGGPGVFIAGFAGCCAPIFATGGGGGGGGYAQNLNNPSFAPNTTVTYQCGVGGAGAIEQNAAGNGGNSQCGSGVAQGNGGVGGNYPNTASGGLFSTGTSGANGGNGAPSVFSNVGQGGGGAAGPFGNGGAGSGTFGGAGDAGHGGAGGSGTGAEMNGGVGAGGGGNGGSGAGGIYGGGGGSGNFAVTGGAGFQGLNIICWTPWTFYQSVVLQ